MDTGGLTDPLAAPGWLLIGAAGRNSGKTTLATALIAAQRERHSIAGAKVATVHDKGVACPRGKDGCGVCSSLVGPYRVTVENGEAEGKDTTLLVQAGADPVLWTVVRRGHMRDAAREMLGHFSTDLVVCESNSLRPVLDPDLFIIVQRSDSKKVKSSCKKVWSLADVVVQSDGQHTDPGVSAFSVVSGRWCIKRRATAVILAGGRSSRMGRDKALLPVGGKAMIENLVDQLEPHFERILVSANDPQRYEFLGLPVVRDPTPGLGPMAGVASALATSTDDINFVVPCDVPNVPVTLMTRLLRIARSEPQIVVPVTPDGFHEPLFGVYKKGVGPILDRALDSGERKILNVIAGCPSHTEPMMPGESLCNVNTHEQYQALLEAKG